MDGPFAERGSRVVRQAGGSEQVQRLPTSPELGVAAASLINIAVVSLQCDIRSPVWGL